MRPAILLLSLTAFLTVHLPAAAVLPSVISTAQLDNTCQCDCCYQITEYQTECLSPNDAFFEISSCSQCTASQCSTRFPTPCSQPSSVVRAKCTTEHTAFFRLVPALFILATIALLIYGFFFKKFDGYHREQTNTPIVNHQSPQYNTFLNNPGMSHPNESTKLLSRRSQNVTALPTIDEEEETPFDEHNQQITSTETPTPPQPPRHDPPPPAQQAQLQHPSLPLVHDDTDLDTRVSEVATVDSDSTYARDLPLLSEIPQPEAFDTDAHVTSHDVRHAAEANPRAIFERYGSELDQLDSTTTRTETVEDGVVADQEAAADNQIENLSASSLSGVAMNADISDQLDSKPDADEGDRPIQKDAQTADVESQSTQQVVHTAKTTEDPDVTEEVSQKQTPTEDHSEPGLQDATDDTSGMAPNLVQEVSDIGAESPTAPQVTDASPTREELDTSALDDSEPSIEEAPADLDDSPNVPSETALDTSAVAHIVATDDSDAVQSELEPAQDSSVSETPYISMLDQAIEEPVETEDQTIVSVNDDLSTVDVAKDTTAEGMQSDHTEPTDTTPISEVQIDPAVEDTARGHAQDVPPEAIKTEESVQEQRAHEEERSIAPHEDVESIDPKVNKPDTVTEAIPEPAALPMNDSTKAVETTITTEMSPETVLETNVVARTAVGFREELAEPVDVEDVEGKDLEPVSDGIKIEPDSSEQDTLSAEHIPEGEESKESHDAVVVGRESPFAESGETVLESQEDADSPALVEDIEEVTQSETPPPSEAQQHPAIDVDVDVAEVREKDPEPVSDVTKLKPDSSEQVAASVEHIPDGEENKESHEAAVFGRESPFAESGETVLESQEDVDSPALVDGNEEVTPSEAQRPPAIDVSETPVEENLTVRELGLEEAREPDVERQFIRSEEVDISVSDHQVAHSETLPRADDVRFEADHSRLTEDAKEENITVREQVAEAEEGEELKLPVPAVEAEALGAEELGSVEPSTALEEPDLETLPSQTEETGTSDRATQKDTILESQADVEQLSRDSEVVAYDLDAPKPLMPDSAMPEKSASITVDEGRDPKVSDSGATELTGISSEDERQAALQSEGEVERVAGQKIEPGSLASEANVQDGSTQELVNADYIDAGRYGESISQQETEPSAMSESVDVDSSITDTVDAEKVVITENDTESEMTNTESVERFLSEPENTEQTETEANDLREIETKPEVVESEAVEPEAAEPSLREADDVLELARELGATEPAVIEAVTVEPNTSEPITTENKISLAEAMDSTAAEPLNIRPKTMESAFVEQVTVERGPASVEIEVEARDVPSLQSTRKEVMETEGIDGLQDAMKKDIESTDSTKGAGSQDTLVEAVLPAVTDPEDVEVTAYEAQVSDQDADAQLLGVSEVSVPVGTEGETIEPVVQSSTAIEDVEAADRAAAGPDPGLLDAESHEIHYIEETLLAPDQVEQQESEGSVVKEANEGDIRSAESEALEVEVAHPTVSEQGMTEAETVEDEMQGRPENVEPLSGASNIIESQQESDEHTQGSADSLPDGLEFAEISSARTPILMSEVVEAEGMRADVIDRVEVDDELLSAELVGEEVRETQAIDENTAVAQVVEEVAADQSEGSEAVDANVEERSTLKQLEESETRTDEFATYEAAGSQMSEMVAEVNAEHEDVSTNERTEEDHTDGTSKKELHMGFQEETHNITGVDSKAVDEKSDEVETSAPDLFLQSGSETGVLERNESLLVEISESPENSCPSSDGQPEVIEVDIEPAGPSSIHVSEEVGQKIDDVPTVAVPLAELEAAEAGAASDLLGSNKEHASLDLPPPENDSTEENIEIAASSETAGTVAEGRVEPDFTIAEHHDNGGHAIDPPATSTKVAVAPDVEADASANYSEGDSAEAATPQDVSEPTLTDGNTSEAIGYVEDSAEKSFALREGKEQSNEMVAQEIFSAVENVDRQ